MDRLHLLVTGRVQGVWYRGSTVQRARDLGLVGWVRNLRDGRVEAVAEGERSSLEALLAWANEGPPSAKVDDVEAVWADAEGSFGSFDQVATV